MQHVVTGGVFEGPDDSVLLTSRDSVNTTNLHNHADDNALLRDLTREAREDRLGPIEGREDEAAQLLKALKREGVRRALVVGKPGTGKTTVVEATAMLLAADSSASNISLVELNLPTLSAYTIRAYEQGIRLLASLKEDPEIVLFIEGLDQLSPNAGSTSKGVKEFFRAIDERRISVVATMTSQEFDQAMDEAPERLEDFDIVHVDPLTESETVKLLQLMKAHIQSQQGVQINTAAIQRAAKLSVKFLPDRELPGKAIEILYRACGRFKTKSGMHEVEDEWLDEDSMLFLGKKVRSHDITRAIADMTGRDVDAELEATWENKAQRHLEKIVFGQSQAIKFAANAMAKMQIASGARGRTAGACLFMGPKGVGKAHTARAIGGNLVSSKKDMLIFNLARYDSPELAQDIFGHSKTLGGSFQDGALTQAVSQARKICAIFENVELAHPEILESLGEIIGTGLLTGDGPERISFSKCIFFLITSKVGPEFELSHPPKDCRDLAAEIVPDKALSHLDAIIGFAPLNEMAANRIVQTRIDRYTEHLAKREITLEVNEDVIELIIRKVFGYQSGASGLDRLLRKAVFKPIDDLIRSEKVKAGMILRLAVSDGRIVVRAKRTKSK